MLSYQQKTFNVSISKMIILSFLFYFTILDPIFAQREILSPLYDVNDPKVNALLDKIYLEMVGMDHETSITFDETNKLVSSKYKGGWKECWQFFNSITNENIPEKLNQVFNYNDKPIQSFADLYNNIYNTNFQNPWWSDKIKTWSQEIRAIFAQQGGICPTFIQPSSSNKKIKITDKNKYNEELFGRIIIPFANSLLRSDIPIYGVAGGKCFKKYKVEYGSGKTPDTWYLIDESNIAKSKFDQSQIPSLMQGDVDLRGNLATWNTGLKNWEHLPWHSKEDTIDFNGTYTIRLLVEGINGEKVEDQVTCKIGRAIAQCLSGIAISPDKRIRMIFPEHSLMYPFRIYSILPISPNEEKISPVNNIKYVSEIYSIDEAGDQFIKDVVLEFKVSKGEFDQGKNKNISIAVFNIEKNNWDCLTTLTKEKNDTLFFSTLLQKLPQKRALFVLLADESSIAHSNELEKVKIKAVKDDSKITNGIFVNDDFEKGKGNWKERDRLVGALLSIDSIDAINHSHSLKITNQVVNSNFSVTICDRPFNINEYSIMSFDYKIEAGVKTDFYFKMNGRWYNLGFTDDPTDFRNKDVNIENLGALKDIYQDNKWHAVSINLHELFKPHTRNCVIDEIIMANWDVNGYMKLDFGINSAGASYSIDNFKIQFGNKDEVKSKIIVDDFESAVATNYLSGPSGTYLNPGSDFIKTEILKEGKNQFLSLNYKTTDKDAYCGYWTALNGLNLENMKTLEFDLKHDGSLDNVMVGLRYLSKPIEAKVPLKLYIQKSKKMKWDKVVIPLAAFIGNGLPDLLSMDVLFLAFDEKNGSGKGNLLIDNIEFNSSNNFNLVADFNKNGNDKNMLGGVVKSSSSEAATIKNDLCFAYDDTISTEKISERITYGGNIGLSHGGRKFSYSIWETGLQGIDASNYKNLIIRIKGQKGDEQPNIYLHDGCTRKCLRPFEYGKIGTEWQNLILPLDLYKQKGIDLSFLETLQFVFEWKEMSGTIYIDRIWFE